MTNVRVAGLQKTHPPKRTSKEAANELDRRKLKKLFDLDPVADFRKPRTFSVVRLRARKRRAH